MLSIKSSLVGLCESFWPSLAKRCRFRIIEQSSLADLRGVRLFEPELKILPALLEGEEGVCFDIGAHIGEYCFVLEKIVHPSQIYAFEPNPQSHAKLRKFFPRIHIENIALSDRAGTAEMTVPVMKGRLYETRGTLEKHVEPGEMGKDVIRVGTVTLDDFCSAEGISTLNFLKIDVEGHELKVLVGGKNVIKKQRPLLQVEIEHRHHKEPFAQVIMQIEHLGYRGYYLDLFEWRFMPVSDFDPKRKQQYEMIKTAEYVNNFLFLPLEKEGGILQRLDRYLKDHS